MARPQRRRVAAVLGLAAAIAALPGCSSQSGPNSCAYHDDGECDEPASGTGVCRTGTDYADCVTLQNGCQYAHDGECDEPGPAQWGRTGRCASGTDSDDCCPEHAHSSAGQVACTCNYNYRADARSQTCVPASGAPPTTAACRECEESCHSGAEGVDPEATDVCLEDCRFSCDPNASGLVKFLVLVGAMIALCFPCFVFGVVQLFCIRDRRTRNQQPRTQAWHVCTSLFTLALVCTWFPYAFWLWFAIPFAMVLPFCMDRCCASSSQPFRPSASLADSRVHADEEVPEHDRVEITDSQRPRDCVVTVQAVPVQEPPAVVAVASPLALSFRPESAEPQASDARAESTTSGLAHSAEPQVASAVNPAAAEVVDATASVENPVAADAATPGTVSASFEVEDEYAHGDFAVPAHAEPDIAGEAMSDGEAHLPSVVAGSAQPGVDVGAHSSTELRDFLVGNDLGQFEDALRSLGAVNVEDLHELDEVT